MPILCRSYYYLCFHIKENKAWWVQGIYPKSLCWRNQTYTHGKFNNNERIFWGRSGPSTCPTTTPTPLLPLILILINLQLRIVSRVSSGSGDRWGLEDACNTSHLRQPSRRGLVMCWSLCTSNDELRARIKAPSFLERVQPWDLWTAKVCHLGDTCWSPWLWRGLDTTEQMDSGPSALEAGWPPCSFWGKWLPFDNLPLGTKTAGSPSILATQASSLLTQASRTRGQHSK